MSALSDPFTGEALPSRLTLLRPKPPNEVFVAIRPVKDAEGPLTEALRKDLKRNIDAAKRQRELQQQQQHMDGEQSPSPSPLDDNEEQVEEEASTMLLSTETQLLLDSFINLCFTSFTKLAKFGHWLSAWEVLQKTEALVDAYGDQTSVKLQSSMQDRLYRMYGSYERLRQRGLESANCAPTKGIKSLLPADQRPDNVILQLHSLPIESRQQLLFGSKKKNPSSSSRPTPEAASTVRDGHDAAIATVAAPLNSATRPPLSRPNSARSTSASLPPTRPQSAKPPTSTTYRRPSTDPKHNNTANTATSSANAITSSSQNQNSHSGSGIPDVMKVDKFYGRTDPKFNLQGVSRRKETNFPTRLQKRPTSAHTTIAVKNNNKASSRPSSAKPANPPPGGFSATSCYVCSTLPSNGGDVVPTRPKTSRPVTASTVRTSSSSSMGPPTRPNSAKSATTTASKAPSWANCNSPYLDNVVPLSRKPQVGKGSSAIRPGKPSLPLHPPTVTHQLGRPPPPTATTATTTAVSGLPAGHGDDDFIIVEDDSGGEEEVGAGGSTDIITTPTDSSGLQQMDDHEAVSSKIFPILDPSTVHPSEVNFREWPPYHMASSRSRRAGGASSTTTIGPDGPSATRIHFERQWRSPVRVTLYYLGETSETPSTHTSSNRSQASSTPSSQIEDQPIDEAVEADGDDNDGSEEALLEKLHKLNARHDEKIDKIRQSFELTPNQVRIVTTCAKMFLAKCSTRRLKSQIQAESDTRVAEENHVDEPYLVPRRPSINSRRDSEIDALEAQLSTRMATIQAKVAKFKEEALIAEANEKIRLATAPPKPKQGTSSTTETTCCVSGCCPLCGSPSKGPLRQGRDSALQTTEVGIDESTQVPTNTASVTSTPHLPRGGGT